MRCTANAGYTTQILLLHVDSSIRDEQVKRLEKNLDPLLQFQHPNVMRYFNHQQVSLQDEVKYRFLMEFCSGGTLHNYATKSPVTGPLLVNWTHQLLNGLAYLHQHHYVHHQINSMHVLLSSADPATCHLKIAGLAHVKKALEHGGRSMDSNLGMTTRFMSPEEIMGLGDEVEESVAQKTDIWSLGCVMIEMVTGTMPKFHKSTGADALIEITGDLAVMYFVGKNGSPTIPSEISIECENFMKQCLKNNGTDRPSAEELKGHPFLSAT
ncbi:uncharacterized protein LOC129585183 isoform X2 [Paramacrobiotus metropolitanus]|uniref:uncharacterized protein LOC129585183 isoform X2 n=1 Tax=Paramacrobiotus metropolitanus TaxID=2943436 RepID=UPI0024465AE3|nr:uncharacterized protein LOC129585183 isoform X2 [Paramacrobiotus metropolitanus]